MADPLDPSSPIVAGGGCDGCDPEGPTYHANCPSAVFAHELKFYEDPENPVVIGYNRSLMEK